jgi:hypothetical protein
MITSVLLADTDLQATQLALMDINPISSITTILGMFQLQIVFVRKGLTDIAVGNRSKEQFYFPSDIAAI